LGQWICPAILGLNVRRERRRLGKSQEELAFDADMKRSYLSDLERGTRNPSVKAVGRLAVALGVEPGALLKAPTLDDPDRPRSPRPKQMNRER
jgi:transcriptional regulator with XRE-family HTH domain